MANKSSFSSDNKFQPQDNAATEMIRQKIKGIYKDEEPDLKTEASEAEQANKPSVHQKFVQDLVASGKSVADIQTEWHNYYQSLSEEDKMDVWDEFYKSNQNVKKASVITPSQPAAMSQLKNEVISNTRPKGKVKKPRVLKAVDKPATKETKPKVNLKFSQHLQSLLFGLGLGCIVIVIFLFSFFNEIIIAPFIQPERNASVPVIIGENTIAPTSNPEVIVPKINVEIPVDYNVNTTNENVIENDLEGGVIHFPTTVDPGQIGNAAFFGHSSNNIFNPGQYKFAFVLLHTLVNGDTFYLTYNHTVFVYKVISHFVVNPNDTAVLGPVSGQTATATLITCDPPGTSINRLIVIGQQISPEISTDVSATPAISNTAGETSLPSNGPSLWTRVISSSVGKIIVAVIAVLVIVIGFRRISKKEPA